MKNNSSLAALLPIAVAYWFFSRVTLPRRTRRLFEQRKGFHDKTVMVFDANGVRVSSRIGSSDIPWAYFHKWRADPQTLLLYQSDAVMNIVPLRALPDTRSREALLAMVEARLGPPV